MDNKKGAQRQGMLVPQIVERRSRLIRLSRSMNLGFTYKSEEHKHLKQKYVSSSYQSTRV